jgi:hypothetical protein
VEPCLDDDRVTLVAAAPALGSGYHLTSVDSADVGYYLAAPGRAPAVSHGLQIDAELVDAASRYPGTPGRAAGGHA